jgi:hypothetical protein
VREPHDFTAGHFAEGTHCLIGMTNGKFIGVTEPCAEVRSKIGKSDSAGQPPCVLVCGGTAR